MAATALFAAMAATSLANAYSQSEALKQQGEFQRQQSEINASFADLRAEDARTRGDRAASEHQRQVRQLLGKQRASLAAQGIAIDSGSAGEMQLDTLTLGAMDEMQIRTNAWREAWGYRMEGRNMLTQGQMAELAAQNDARSTLLTGTLHAADFGVRGYQSFAKTKKTGGK